MRHHLPTISDASLHPCPGRSGEMAAPSLSVERQKPSRQSRFTLGIVAGSLPRVLCCHCHADAGACGIIVHTGSRSSIRTAGLQRASPVADRKHEHHDIFSRTREDEAQLKVHAPTTVTSFHWSKTNQARCNFPGTGLARLNWGRHSC